VPNRFLGEPDPTTARAKAAVDGKLFTCGELVRHAAERHVRDIRDGERRGIYWRSDAAAHFLNFLPSAFQVTDGPAAGEPFHPLEYHTFVGGSAEGAAWQCSGRCSIRAPMRS
jgi:hypothetical protein